MRRGSADTPGVAADSLELPPSAGRGYLYLKHTLRFGETF
jgi:hypothetical protein